MPRTTLARCASTTPRPFISAMVRHERNFRAHRPQNSCERQRPASHPAMSERRIGIRESDNAHGKIVAFGDARWPPQKQTPPLAMAGLQELHRRGTIVLQIAKLPPGNKIGLFSA